MLKDCNGLWYAEYDDTDGTHYHSVRSVVYSGRTAYQDVTILDTEEWGKTLIVDGDIQSTELDESIFHEAAVHPAMLAHPNPSSVLILGSGEGGMLREILSYGSVKRVVMSDIDEEFVDICAEHLPEWSEGCFEDPMVEFEFDDGKEYLQRCDTTFDIIIADLVEHGENGSASHSHDGRFYKQLRDHLSPGGILAIHGLEFDPLEPNDHTAARKILSKIFPVVLTYSTYIPSFKGESAFLIASDGPNPSQLSEKDITTRLAKGGASDDKDIGGPLYFYDAAAHVRMFSLPKHVKAALNGSMSAEDGDG